MEAISPSNGVGVEASPDKPGDCLDGYEDQPEQAVCLLRSMQSCLDACLMNPPSCSYLQVDLVAAVEETHSVVDETISLCGSEQVCVPYFYAYICSTSLCFWCVIGALQVLVDLSNEDEPEKKPEGGEAACIRS